MQCSHYMRSLKIWATSCANTYREENHLLLTCGATMQHSFAFSMQELKQRLQTCHTRFAWIPAHSNPHKSNQSPLSLFILISMKVGCSNVACVPRYSHIDAFYLNESVLSGVSNVSLFGISHWMNVTIHNEFRLELHYQANVYRKCMLIFSLSGMGNMKS